MQMLQHRQIFSTVQDVRSVMHPLWGEDYSVLAQPTNHHLRVCGTAQGCSGGVGEVGPQRGRNSSPGQGSIGDWPGREYGVRRPHPEETPLSWSEVMHAVRGDGL